MMEVENRQENWSRVLKWLAIIAIIAFLIFITFFIRVPNGVIE
jgi:hypothetical protein